MADQNAGQSSTASKAAALPPLQGVALIIAVFVVAVANFMAVLDMTIVNVAIPHIAGSLAVSQNEGTWVITSYAVAEAITVPLTGWLAARFGAVRVFAFAALGFGFFSALCGLATTLPMLVVFRVFQGLSGGPLMPMSQTLLLHITPKEHQNLALGGWTMTTILAPVIGPLLGGTMADSVGWEWAFYINVPIALICAFFAWRLLAPRETERVKSSVDYIGLGLLIVWVGALQIMLDNGENDDWFSSPFILTLAIIATVGFISFLIWELTEAHPIVDLRVFRHRGFAVSAGAMLLTFGSFFGSIVLVPLWLQVNMGYTATEAGYLVAYNGALGLVMAPIAALLISRMDARILMSFGISVIAASTLWRVTFTPDMTFSDILPAQLALGIGMPFFFVPMMSMAMAAVKPEETASAAGLINFLRTMSGAFATAIVITAWQSGTRAAHVDSVGRLNDSAGVVNTLRHAGMSYNQALHALDNMVQNQSVMLSTNHIFLIVGGILLLAAAGVWLMPKPQGLAGPVIAH